MGIQRMKVRSCEWLQGDVTYKLKTETNQNGWSVNLTIDEDVSVKENNPITILIRLDQYTALTEKFYFMQVGGISIRNIPEDAAKDIAKTLDCSLSEHCEACGRESELMWDTSGKYHSVCSDCLKLIEWVEVN